MLQVLLIRHVVRHPPISRETVLSRLSPVAFLFVPEQRFVCACCHLVMDAGDAHRSGHRCAGLPGVAKRTGSDGARSSACPDRTQGAYLLQEKKHPGAIAQQVVPWTALSLLS